ncbi:MAG: LCP family protein [Erysipelotrichaceae bacterium]|nr:LCP family protein [Erysipelotrichaceae bacterium]
MTNVKMKNKKIKRNMSLFNIIFGVIVLFTNILWAFIFVNLNRFSNISKTIFAIINIVMLLILLTLNIVYILTVRTKRTVFFNTLVTMGVLLFSIGSYGTYAVLKVNKNLNKIVQKGDTSEKVETSFVIYDEKAEFKIETEEGLEGKTVGIVSGSTNGELAKTELTNKKINVSYREFNDNNELLLALFNSDVDAAALPSNYIGIFEVNDGYSDLLKNTKAISTFSSSVAVEATKTSDKDITKEPFTVLVLGVDEGRSDAVILASFNPISMKLTMTSIPRDSYVPIACYSGQSSDKLGHARVRSRQCTIDTVSKLMGVDIDYYFESNFKGIVEMVDALGGIVVNNPYEFVGQSSSTQRGHYTVWVPKGENAPLNGEQALAFARERHLYASGDFQRQANQQQVIKAILTKAMRTADLNKLLNVLDAAGDNVSTNLSVNQLIDLFNHVMKKANRYYDDSHLENVIQIEGSRVSGYNSGIWNESLQLTLSIIRLYEGSIKDNRAAILRNMQTDDTISTFKTYRWDANWVFVAPTVSNETYSEKIVPSEVPDTVLNFIGKGVDAIQSWASSRGITIHVNRVDCSTNGNCGNYGDNIIFEQSVRAGIKVSNVTEITVSVTGNTAATKATTGKFDVVVRYKYEDGSEAHVKYEGKTDENGSYHINSPEISGYTANPTIVNGTATANVDVTVIYKKNNSSPTPSATTCPAGKKLEGNQCVNDESTEIGCKANGKTWDNGNCLVKQSCPEGQKLEGNQCVNDLNTQKGCSLAGKHWYNNQCNDSPQKTPEEACKESGKHWYNNQCNDSPQKSQEQIDCESKGGTWNGACQLPPTPDNSGNQNGGTSGGENGGTSGEENNSQPTP